MGNGKLELFLPTPILCRMLHNQVSVVELALVLVLPDGEVNVTYTDTTPVFLTTDGESPTGSEADLSDGAAADVSGEVGDDGVLAADSIRLL